MREVKISISGAQGAGKTSVGVVIYNALKEAGIEVVVTGEDRLISDRITTDQVTLTQPMRATLVTVDEVA